MTRHIHTMGRMIDVSTRQTYTAVELSYMIDDFNAQADAVDHINKRGNIAEISRLDAVFIDGHQVRPSNRLLKMIHGLGIPIFRDWVMFRYLRGEHSARTIDVALNTQVAARLEIRDVPLRKPELFVRRGVVDMVTDMRLPMELTTRKLRVTMPRTRPGGLLLHLTEKLK